MSGPKSADLLGLDARLWTAQPVDRLNGPTTGGDHSRMEAEGMATVDVGREVEVRSVRLATETQAPGRSGAKRCPTSRASAQTPEPADWG